jgi:hypothetical protein
MRVRSATEVPPNFCTIRLIFVWFHPFQPDYAAVKNRNARFLLIAVSESAVSRCRR